MLLSNSWQKILEKNYDYNELLELINRVNTLRNDRNIFPKESQVFSFLELTSYEDLKVVIIGQDPYFNPGQANGLAFSVNKGIKLPPSLKNIYKELYDDLAITPEVLGPLQGWAKQGVMLINSTLTVEEGRPNSHKDLGWDKFTDFIISYISDTKNNIVFVLWGNFALKKKVFIDQSKHLILESSHPSPLSARHSFFGSRVFSKINSYLKSCNKGTIDWSKSHDY